MTIDLRSDFIGRPTGEMVKAMTKAAGVACSFGLRESPIQRDLESLAAHMLGKEDALFFPTCTMCNQTAINIFCSPGEKFIAEAESHCVLSEAGAPAAISGVMAKAVPGESGYVKPEDMEAAIKLGDELRSRTSLIILENTHNRAGGAVLSEAQMRQTREIADRHAIPIHLDGARLFNAAVHLGVSVSVLATCADSVAISLNKGLSAPLGAMLAGNKSFIQDAMRVRQRLGGGWRPTNIPAAAGIVALETMVDRLAEDHAHARMLAEGIARCKGVHIDLEKVQTNIILARFGHPSITVEDLIEALKERNILVIRFGGDAIRMALHWEIVEQHVHEVIDAFSRLTGTT